MKKYELLAEPDRDSRRTVMDALEVLRNEAGFQDGDRAQFHIGLLRPPSGDKVGLIQLRFDAPLRDATSCVSLPAATYFNAIPKDFPARRRFEVERLDQAFVDGWGHIELIDGNQLRALEIEPANLPLNPTDLDWRIVHLTLELIGAKDCYRSLRDDLSPDRRETIPDICILDVARLSTLNLPPLRDIARYVVSKYQKVSGQQVANSLRKFGIRHPQKRPM